MFKKFLVLMLSLFLAACMTTGYHYAKDPHMVRKWDVTVISVKPQNIYNSVGVALVGPLASVESKGLEVKFIADGEKKEVAVVQPSSDQYTLQPGQRAVYIVASGRVWVQPADYPLPPEFSAQVPAPKEAGKVNEQQEKLHKQAQTPSRSETKTTGDSAKERDISDRLKKLNLLKENGLITQEEYLRKKQEIIDSL